MLRLLKDGGGVTTYLAPGRDGDDPVVIKLADLNRVGTAASMRLTHEADVLARLSGPDGHPFLVDHGVAEGYIWLAHRYQSGQTLAARLDRGPLDVDETLIVAAHVLAQLVAAHGHSVVHRDIKPANIVVDEDGPLTGATLIDFGLAQSRRLSPTLQGVAVGTARYCSPEQAGLIDLPVDERSDLYSLGLTLFECLTGRPLLDGEGIGDILRQHLAPKPLASDLASGVPRAVSEMIARLTQTDPDRRYQTAEAALVDAEDVAAGRRRGLAEPPVVIGRYDRRRSLADPGFVGRRKELAALEGHLRTAEDGGRGIVVVEGEAGSGKSRLLDELGRRAAARGFVVMRGTGEDRTASRPFQLFDGVISELAGVAASDAVVAGYLHSHLSDQAEAVAAVAPPLAPLLDIASGGDPLPDEYGPSRSFAALSAVIEACGSGPRPALVILDDCQWAETLASRVLTQWAAETGRCRVLVIVAFRSDELVPSSPLRALPTLASVNLGGLGPDDIRDLVTSMAGPVPEEAVQAVVRLADGNAFMAQAVLRGMTESGSLVRTDSGWTLDPDSAREIQTSRRAALFLVRRLDALQPEARTLLSATAVVGKETDVDLAVMLSGLPADAAVPALDELCRRRILWMDESRDRVRFAHDMLREAVLERIGAEERSDLHFRAANHFLAAGPDAPFQIAYHLDMAGLPFDAYPHALKAAEEARSRHALDEAALYYGIAAKGATDDAARYRIYDGLGEVLSLAGNYGEAERHYREAAAVASGPVEEAAELGKLGEVAFRRGDHESACARLETAVRTLRGRVPRSQAALIVALLWELAVQAVHSLSGNRLLVKKKADDRDLLRIRFCSRLAYAYWFRSGRLRCLWVHLREMNMAERFGHQAAMAQAYSEHAPVMTMIPWHARGIAYARRSLELRRDLGDVWGQGQSLNFYGVALYAASRYRDAMTAFEESGRILAVTGDRWEMNTGLWNLALCHYRLGEWDRARVVAADLVQSAGTIGDRTSAGIALAVVARATSGRAPDPRMIAEASGHSSADQHTAAELRLAAALSANHAGHPADAAHTLTEAVAAVKAAGLRQEYVAPLLPWSATMMRHQLEQLQDEAERDVLAGRQARVAADAVRLSRWYRNNLPHALRERALVRVRAGRLAGARQDLDRSIALAREHEAAWEEAASRAERGRLGVLLGWPGADQDLAIGTESRDRIEASGRGGSPGEPSATLSLADRLDQLLAGGRDVVANTTAGGVLKAVEDAAATMLRADHAFAVAVDGDGQPEPELAGVASEIVSLTVLREAVTSRRIVRHSGEQADAADSLVLAGIRSTICAPIIADGRVAACLYATHREVEGLFGEEEEQVMGYLATLAGAALEHVAGSEAYFRGLVENSYDVTVVVGADGDAQYVSPPVSRILGRSPEEVLGAPQFDLMHPDDMPGLAEQWTAVLADAGATRAAEVRFRHADGTWRWMDLTLTNRLDDPNVGGLVVNLRDSTERRRAEAELARASEQFRLAFDHAPIGMALVDQSPGQPSQILLGNDSLAAMLGQPSTEALTGLSLEELIHPDEVEMGKAARRSFESGASDVNDGELRLHHSSGPYLWVRYHAALIRDDEGRPDYFIAQVVDITEQRAAEKRLLHQALHDPLTGLPNRRLFMQRLEQALSRAERLDHRIAVLFLDLDRFKVINDSYGHAAGDAVLVEAARRLQELTRTSDTLARLGGDEFVVLVEDVGETAETRAIAQRIEDTLSLPMTVPPDIVITVTTSIGITVARPGDNPAGLLRDADTALYRAKDRGRARHEVFGEHMRMEAVGRMSVERELRAALDEDRLVALYRPVVDLASGRAVGAHAVLHYRDPSGTIVGQEDFADVAEETGLVTRTNSWLLSTACRDLAIWQRQLEDDELTVTVAVSPRQLADPGFVAAVRSTLEGAGVKESCLSLEIAEGHLAQSVETGREALDRLKEAGCRLGIAGFGNGSSSLAYVRRLPIDFIKIDPAFVTGVGTEREDQTIVSAVTQLAQAFNVTSVADGVSTRAQEQALRAAGCDLAEGPRFGRLRRASDLVLPR